MNNYKQRKQKYLLVLPVLFMFFGMVNLYRSKEGDGLVLVYWCASFIVTLWLSFPFYILKGVVDRSGVKGDAFSQVIKVKVLASCVLVCSIFTISLGLNEVYALFLTIFGMLASMAIFSTVARRRGQDFKGLLYASAPETYSKKVVKFFVGEIDWELNEVSSADNINPATGLPMMGAGYDSHGNAYGTSSSSSLSDSDSDYNR